MEDVLDFLTAPLSTEELKRQVELLRHRMEQRVADEVRLSTELSDVNLDLDRMEAKTNFLISMAGQLLELSALPPPEGLEALYDDRKKTIYDPMQYGTAIVGVGGVGLMALGDIIGPTTLKTVGFLTRSTRITQAAKSTRLAKIAKFGRASVYLAIGASILDLAVKMVEASKINAYLAEKRDEFEEQLAEADRVLARYEVAIEQGNAYRAQVLSEAEVETVNEYLGLLNDAIKDLGEQASTARMTRNLLRMGQSKDQIAALMPNLDRNVIESIARRLSAEIGLLEGKSPDEVARETGLTALQAGVVQRVLDARGDAALGYRDAELVDRHGISDAVADLQIDLVDSALPGVWEQIEGDGDLSSVALEALVPSRALEQLRAELPVRGALWSGEDMASVQARFPQVDAERLVRLSEELESEREIAQRTGLQGDALKIALRLPSAPVGAPDA